MNMMLSNMLQQNLFHCFNRIVYFLNSNVLAGKNFFCDTWKGAMLTTSIQLLEAFQYIQIVALSLIKLGALAFYHRIFAVKFHRTKFDYILIATEVVVGLWAIAMLIMNSLQCGSHISALWTGYDVWSEYCATLSPNFEDAFSISNFILDLWILILPLPKVSSS
jgi:hypothetical protein